MHIAAVHAWHRHTSNPALMSLALGALLAAAEGSSLACTAVRGMLPHVQPVVVTHVSAWVALADAYLVALTRIGGIVAGVALILVLSMAVFPKSASHQVGAPPAPALCDPVPALALFALPLASSAGSTLQLFLLCL